MNKSKTYNSLTLMGIAFILSSFLWSCKISTAAKNKTKARDMVILDSLYAQTDYKIAIDVVYPFNTAATTRVSNALLWGTGDSANRINVRGEGNFIAIRNDSVDAYLPFFGERRLNAGNLGSNNTAIQFNAPLQDLSKQLNAEKRKLKLEFTADQKGNDSDRFEITLEIYPNKHVTVNITPVYRTFIRYDGRLEEFEKQD